MLGEERQGPSCRSGPWRTPTAQHGGRDLLGGLACVAPCVARSQVHLEGCLVLPDCSAIIRFISSSYHLRLIDTSREPTFAFGFAWSTTVRRAIRGPDRDARVHTVTRDAVHRLRPAPKRMCHPSLPCTQLRRFASIARRTYSLSPTPALCARRAVAPRRELPDAAAPRLTCGGRPPRHQRDGAPSDGRPTGSPGNCTCLRGPTAGCAAACRPSPTSRAS